MRPEKESLNTFPLVELKSVCSDQIIAGSSVQPNISVEPLLCLLSEPHCQSGDQLTLHQRVTDVLSW